MKVDPFLLQKAESQNFFHQQASKLSALENSAESQDENGKTAEADFSSLLEPSQGIRRINEQPSEEDELKKAFTDFVGQTLFGQWIASMRETQGEPAYMHGGQAERIFQNQLDQILAEEMTKASADSLADPMYELFQLRRTP